MKRDEIAAKVIGVIAKELKRDKEQIKEIHHFSHDLGADSLQSIELVAAFEDEFNLELNEEEALEIQTVGAAIDYFLRLLSYQTS